MNLDQLLHNHRLAESNAQRAQSLQDRDTYFDLVGHYARRITQWRRAHGLSEAQWQTKEYFPRKEVP